MFGKTAVQQKKSSTTSAKVELTTAGRSVYEWVFADSIDVYAKEKLRLKNAGKLLEDFDLLIGCAAKAARLTMVTHNIKHFSHIEGLEIEDWIE